MKLSLFKIFFISILSFLKHIMLFILLNSFCLYFFYNFLYNLITDLIANKFDILLNNNFLTADRIIFSTLVSIAIIVKTGFYVIAINNDKEDVNNELIIYISDFLNNSFYLFTSSFVFLFLFLFMSILILPGIIFVNCCIFYIIFALLRKQTNDKRYTQTGSISKSFSITKGNRIKLVFFNSILLCLFIFSYLNFNYPIMLGGFNINFFIKQIFIDFLIVYFLNVGFDLEKIENKKMEEIESKERENEYNQIRGKSTI